MAEERRQFYDEQSTEQDEFAESEGPFFGTYYTDSQQMSQKAHSPRKSPGKSAYQESQFSPRRQPTVYDQAMSKKSSPKKSGSPQKSQGSPGSPKKKNSRSPSRKYKVAPDGTVLGYNTEKNQKTSRASQFEHVVTDHEEMMKWDKFGRGYYPYGHHPYYNGRYHHYPYAHGYYGGYHHGYYGGHPYHHPYHHGMGYTPYYIYPATEDEEAAQEDEKTNRQSNFAGVAKAATGSRQSSPRQVGAVSPIKHPRASLPIDTVNPVYYHIDPISVSL